MLKRLQDLFKSPMPDMAPTPRPQMIFRQCEDEGPDARLLRELATLSLQATQQPLH